MFEKVKDYINYIKRNPDKKRRVTTVLSFIYAFLAWNTIGLGIYQWRKIAEKEKLEKGEDADFMSSLYNEGDHIHRYKGFKKVEEYIIQDGEKVLIYRSPDLEEKDNKEKELLSEGNDHIIEKD